MTTKIQPGNKSPGSSDQQDGDRGVSHSGDFEERSTTEAKESEVVVKGEIHTSRSDLEEERDLLLDGTDVLILEGESSEAEYGVLRGWYSAAMEIMDLVFFRTLYADKRRLVDLADAQGAQTVATRESNAELVENSSWIVELTAAAIFYGLFIFSIGYGLITGDTLTGALYLLGSAITPILILRYHGMNRFSDKVNRDQIIADKIAEHAYAGKDVVAVVGYLHLASVVDNLPEDINPRKLEPAYDVISFDHAKEVAVPAFTAFSVLFVFYLIIIEFYKNFLIIL